MTPCRVSAYSVLLTRSIPCIRYFLNVLSDTVVGIFSLYIILSITDAVVSYFNLKDYRSGQYGYPPSYRIWMKQVVLFVVLQLLNKSIVLTVFKWEGMVVIGKFLLAPLKVYPKLELVVVMLLLPLAMNTINFWVTDGLLKAKKKRRTMAKDERDILYFDDDDQEATSALYVR